MVLKAHTVPAGAGTNPFPGVWGTQFPAEFGASSPCVALGQSLPPLQASVPTHVIFGSLLGCGRCLGEPSGGLGNQPL